MAYKPAAGFLDGLLRGLSQFYANKVQRRLSDQQADRELQRQLKAEEALYQQKTAREPIEFQRKLGYLKQEETAKHEMELSRLKSEKEIVKKLHDEDISSMKKDLIKHPDFARMDQTGELDTMLKHPEMYKILKATKGISQRVKDLVHEGKLEEAAAAVEPGNPADENFIKTIKEIQESKARIEKPMSMGGRGVFLPGTEEFLQNPYAPPPGTGRGGTGGEGKSKLRTYEFANGYVAFVDPDKQQVVGGKNLLTGENIDPDEVKDRINLNDINSQITQMEKDTKNKVVWNPDKEFDPETMFLPDQAKRITQAKSLQMELQDKIQNRMKKTTAATPSPMKPLVDLQKNLGPARSLLNKFKKGK